MRVIASRVLGDEDAWVTIAELNNFIDPFRFASGRLAQPGDPVFIPALISQSNSVEAVDVFKEDLKLEDGDLVLSEGDYRTIAGVPNLEQAISLRLKAVLGETFILPDYGLPSAVGLRLNAETAGYVSAHMRSQIVKDKRVRSVLLIEARDQGDAIDMSAQFRAVDQTFLSLSVRP